MHPLDNPIYAALSSRQSSFAEANGSARRFVPAISMLAGFEAPSRQAYDALAALVPLGETAGVIVDDAPEPMATLSLLHDARLIQMVFGPDRAETPSHESVELTAVDAPVMIALADITQPGPFGSRTHEFGGYIGIRREGALIAMAGYRMRVPGFTEISAICTHPDHVGRGYARALTSALVARILATGETPFLHVRESNERAVRVYERMGFRIRYRSRFLVLRRV
jgi:ribosomal protein S18 acetylase RimI-like enzyme